MNKETDELTGEGAQLAEHLNHQLRDRRITVILVRCTVSRMILIGTVTAGAGIDIIGRCRLLAGLRIGNGVCVRGNDPVVTQWIYNFRVAVTAFGAGGDHQARQRTGGILLHILRIAMLARGRTGGRAQFPQNIVQPCGDLRQIRGHGGPGHVGDGRDQTAIIVGRNVIDSVDDIRRLGVAVVGLIFGSDTQHLRRDGAVTLWDSDGGPQIKIRGDAFTRQGIPDLQRLTGFVLNGQPFFPTVKAGGTILKTNILAVVREIAGSYRFRTIISQIKSAGVRLKAIPT